MAICGISLEHSSNSSGRISGTTGLKPALARPHADYTLVIDADDVLEISSGFEWPKLSADSYLFTILDPPARYVQVQLVKNTLPWRYDGVLHEVIDYDGGQTLEGLPIVIRRNHDGVRGRNPATPRLDAAVLEEALLTETERSKIARYTFYLAQAYRDCGERERALAAYLKRAELDGWLQEVYVSLCEAANLQQALERSCEEVMATFRRAIESCPSRAEAYHGASFYRENEKRFAEGYDIARDGTPKRNLRLADFRLFGGFTTTACLTSSPSVVIGQSKYQPTK